MIRRRDPHVLLNLNLWLGGVVVRIVRKLQKRKRDMSRVLFPMKLVWMDVLKMLVQLIFRREALVAAGRGAREVSAFSMTLNVPLKLSFIVKERRTQIARILAARRDLSFYRDSVRAEMMIELRHRVELLRTLAAHVLLNLVVRFHVVVQVSDLGE